MSKRADIPRRHISRALSDVNCDQPRLREERREEEEEEDEPLLFLRLRSLGTRVRIGGSSNGMWSDRLSVLWAVLLSARSRISMSGRRSKRQAHVCGALHTAARSVRVCCGRSNTY